MERLQGCLFHLGQTIYRRVCQEGYKILYNEDKAFQEGVRALHALAFIPPCDVIPRFYEIRGLQSAHPTIKIIYKYFAENYIGLDWDYVLFPISFWNCYNRFDFDIPRTNNSLEGWHF